MKIAVCFYGQVRTAKYAAKNLKRYFGDLYQNIDFFIHSWNVDFVTRSLNVLKSLQYIPKLINNNLLDEYKEIYSPKYFVVKDQETFRNRLQYFKGNIDDYRFVSEMYYPYLSFYQVVQSKKKYEAMNNFKYDVVVKLRPDIIFPPDRTLKQDIDNFLEDPTKIHICYNDDVFHIGTSENMDRAADVFKIENKVLRDASKFPFDVFRDFLIEKNIHLTKMKDCRFTVLRNELTDLDSELQYHEICYLNSLLYSEMFYHLHYSWKWWYNPNNSKWKEDMYDILERILHPEDVKILKNSHVIDI